MARRKPTFEEYLWNLLQYGKSRVRMLGEMGRLVRQARDLTKEGKSKKALDALNRAEKLRKKLGL